MSKEDEQSPSNHLELFSVTSKPELISEKNNDETLDTLLGALNAIASVELDMENLKSLDTEAQKKTIYVHLKEKTKYFTSSSEQTSADMNNLINDLKVAFEAHYNEKLDDFIKKQQQGKGNNSSPNPEAEPKIGAATSDTFARILDEITQTESTYNTGLTTLAALKADDNIKKAFSGANAKNLSKEDKEVWENITSIAEELSRVSNTLISHFQALESSYRVISNREEKNEQKEEEAIKKFNQALENIQNIISDENIVVKMAKYAYLQGQITEISQSNAELAKNLKRLLPKSNGDISSFIILPIQRYPRYKLLFAELLKNQKDSHIGENASEIEKAYEKIKGAVDTSNQKVKELQQNANHEKYQKYKKAKPKWDSRNQITIELSKNNWETNIMEIKQRIDGNTIGEMRFVAEKKGEHELKIMDGTSHHIATISFTQEAPKKVIIKTPKGTLRSPKIGYAQLETLKNIVGAVTENAPNITRDIISNDKQASKLLNHLIEGSEVKIEKKQGTHASARASTFTPGRKQNNNNNNNKSASLPFLKATPIGTASPCNLNDIRNNTDTKEKKETLKIDTVENVQNDEKSLKITFKRDDNKNHPPLVAYARQESEDTVKFSAANESMKTEDNKNELIEKICQLAVQASKPNAVFTIAEGLSDERKELVREGLEKAIDRAIAEQKFTEATKPQILPSQRPKPPPPR